MSTTGATHTAPSTRHAALVDLDNVLIVRGRLLRPPAAAPVLAAIDEHIKDMQARAACGRSILAAHMTALAARGWGLTSVPPTPNAADRVLDADGRYFLACGVTDLVVVSGDGFFAALAPAARLHVIAPRECLSQKLRSAATTVTYLPGLATAPGEVAA